MRVELTSVAQARELEPAIRALVDQAIAVEKAALKLDFKAKRELELPEELKRRLDSDAKLAAAFHGLTPPRLASARPLVRRRTIGLWSGVRAEA
jgi:uncharacterized protein YdeI (YjbR/CyaY-like superfamily)